MNFVKKCEKCGTEFTEGLSCPNCQTFVNLLSDDNTQECPFCGKRVIKGFMFCTSCGKKLEEEKKEEKVTDEGNIEEKETVVTEDIVTADAEGQEIIKEEIQETVISEQGGETTYYEEEVISEYPPLTEQTPVSQDVKKYCTTCGALLEEGNQYCTTCGAKI